MAIDDETLHLAGAAELLIDHEVNRATRDIVRAWARAWNELEATWRDAIGDLIAGSADGEWPSPWQVARAERAMAALDAATAEAYELSRLSGVRIMDGTGRIVNLTMEQGLDDILLSQAPADAEIRASLAVRFNRLDELAVDRIVTRTAGQVESALWPLSAQAGEAMRAVLIRGVAMGDNPRAAAREMLRRVEGAFNGGLTRALTIARTEMLDAHREATRGTRVANADLVRGWVWVSALDTRTCPSCWGMHGTEHDIAEPGPDDHQNGRCASIPLLKTWRDLGIDLDEPASMLPDAADRFANLSRADQLAIMGPARLAALDDGRATLADMATKRTTVGWRDSWAPTPVRDLPAA
jgi:SPP1 gp7 family putative phage head morphogenesis protein